MTNILTFGRKAAAPSSDFGWFLKDFSIEVMPRTAAKIADFRALLPEGTRVYVAHIDGTSSDDMVQTAARLVGEGMQVMPHIPARVIAHRHALDDILRRYADLGIDQALLLAGGVSDVRGEFAHSMDLVETGLFDKFGFDRLHFAGHPEGNGDIDPDGSDSRVMDAIRWKQAFSERTDATVALATQFCFEAGPVIAWAERLAAEGVDLPIHIGVAGPAKLQTLIKFAMACGVGPSLRVLTRRAADVTKLLLPFTPFEILSDLARHKAANPDFLVEAVHFFPLGGITTTGGFVNEHGQTVAKSAAIA